jgi:hypothetical protein
MGDLIDSAIKLSRHEAMILVMDMQPKDGIAVVHGLTLEDIRDLVEKHHQNTATLTKAIDVTPRT